LLIILASQLFLVYSADLRVDMLASWCCLISVLLMLDGRYRWAGVWLGIGFLVSQKIIWYGIAANGALAICYLLTTEQRDIRRALVGFNSALVLTLALYVACWSCLADVRTVLHSVFYEAYTQLSIQYYAASAYVYWQAILRDGPLLFLLWPLTLLTLFDVRLREAANPRRVFIFVYATIALLQMISYRQFFPYNSVFLVPAFFLLYAEFFTWVLVLWREPVSQPVVIFTWRQWQVLYLGYSLWVVGIVSYFQLAPLYLLIVIVPLVLWLRVTQPLPWFTLAQQSVLQWLVMITVLVAGVFNPLARTLAYAVALKGEYQQDMIRLAQVLLQDGGEYVAGTPLLYNQAQTVVGLKNLIAPAINYLYTADPALVPVLLPALDMEPRTERQVMQDLMRHPVKLLVNNDRIALLPPSLQRYLHSEFEHYWGSLYLYSPTILPTATHFSLKFTGHYQLETAASEPVMIDGRTYLPFRRIALQRGEHYTEAKAAYRLRLQPDRDGMVLPSASFEECVTCFAKPIVY
jgi:hypothetical protein